MKLSQLVTDISVASDCEITHVTQNSADAASGSLFVCIRGTQSDGHDFASTAYQNGCRCFLAEDGSELSLPADATVKKVPDTRRALALAACNFYGNPSEKMHLVGVTGTKGKTTTALLLSKILNDNQIPCGYIGTCGISYGAIHKETANTTPDALTLQKNLAEMLSAGVKAAVVEISSQALLQARADGTVFESVAFTNLSKDHVGNGEHPSFENYKACKKRLFTDFSAKYGFYFTDCPEVCSLLADTSVKKITCSEKGRTDYSLSNLSLTNEGGGLGVRFSARHGSKEVPVRLPMIGKFNANNALLAMAIAEKNFGISLQKSANSMESARIPGRSEVYSLESGACAVIDYAHNEDSLFQLLSALKEYPHNRLICLFGSVGDRTRMRRRELGRVASELADFCILTSDNPGCENPEKILDEIHVGFSNTATPYQKIPNRESAIRYAVNLAKQGDILVLAGKGQENYQLIGKDKIPFSEKEILLDEDRKILSGL